MTKICSLAKSKRFYLDSTAQHSTAQQPTIESEVIIKEIDEGLCYGFSVVHSYMATTGYGSWWDEQLRIISKWNGTEGALKQVQEFQLPQRETVNVTLEQVFEKVISYVILNQANRDILEFIKNVRQSAFLEPVSELSPAAGFEESPSSSVKFDSELGPIRHRELVAGHFSSDQMCALLEESVFSEPGIFLIANVKHACAIRYAKPNWYFYDPNEALGEVKYEDKNVFINKIFNTLGGVLNITAASWDMNTKDDFTALATKYADMFTDPGLLQEGGLDMIIRHVPEQLPAIITAFTLPSLVNNVPELFKVLCFVTLDQPRLQMVLVSELKRKNKLGLTGLAQIVKDAPDILLDIFDWVSLLQHQKNTKLITEIVDTILLKNDYESSDLYYIAKFAPDQLPKLYSLFTDTPLLIKEISEVLQLQYKSGKINLRSICTWAPEQLSVIFNLAKDDPLIRKAIADALPIQKGSSDNSTILHDILWSGSGRQKIFLDGLIELANMDPEFKKAIVTALPIINDRGLSAAYCIKDLIIPIDLSDHQVVSASVSKPLIFIAPSAVVGKTDSPVPVVTGELNQPPDQPPDRPLDLAAGEVELLIDMQSRFEKFYQAKSLDDLKNDLVDMELHLNSLGVYQPSVEVPGNLQTTQLGIVGKPYSWLTRGIDQAGMYVINKDGQYEKSHASFVIDKMLAIINVIDKHKDTPMSWTIEIELPQLLKAREASQESSSDKPSRPTM